MHIGMVAFTDLRYDFRIYREATALAAAGHRVSVVASLFHAGPSPAWEGITIVGLPVNRARSLRHTYPSFWRRATQALKTVAPTAVHGHDLDALWPAARVAQQLRAPLVYDSHELWTEQSSLLGRPHVRAFWRLLERRLIRTADHTITVSQPIADELQRRYRLRAVGVIRNLPPYRAPLAGDPLRPALGLAPSRPVVLYQGGFLTENGLAEVIAAAPGFGDAALVLLGDGPDEDRLRRLVAQAGLEQRVLFHPRVPFAALHAYTCAADVGLCLIKGTCRSFAYSLPNKLFEYLMAGLPVLASDLPEMGRVVTEAQVGLVVDPLDPQQVAHGVRALLADPGQRARWRLAALAAARRFCWEEEAHQLLALYPLP